MPRSDATLPVLLLLLLALLTFWLTQAVRLPVPESPREQVHEPDAIIDNFTARQYGPSGELRYVLNAQKMLHYGDDDSATLQTVTFNGQQPNQPPFSVRSQRGRVTSKAQDVFFEGDVVAVQESGNGAAPIVMKTAFLHVMPQAGIAKTDQPVVVEQGSTTVRAAGMELHNETRVVNLTHVKATYYPARAGR